MSSVTKDSTTPSPQLSEAPSHYGLFVAFIAIIGAFSSLVNDMYLPTIPTMMRQFHTTPSMTQMGISMAMAGMGLGSVVWGSASDRYGRKPILTLSLIIFVLATAVSLFSRDIVFFIICRFFQGLGAGGAMVLSTSIPADVYMGRQLAKLMAIVGAINGVAPALGACGRRFYGRRGGMARYFRDSARNRPCDGLLTSRYKETLPPQRRIQTRSMSGYIAAYRTLLTNGRFMLYVTIKVVAIGLLYAYISSAPFIIQDHYGYTSMEFGLIFGGNALAMGLGATLALRFKVMKQAMVAGCAGMFVFALGGACVMCTGASFALYEVCAIPMLLFSGMIFSSANTLSMEVGRAEAGTASAILSVVKYVFAAIVSPLVGLGDMMHSTAIAFVVVTLIAVILAWPAYRMAPLSDMERTAS